MTTTQITKLAARMAEQDLTPLVTNILAVYREATPEQFADGASWYGEAHSLALALDPANPLAAAGVISALSPQKSWAMNKILATRAYADGVASGHTPDCNSKVNRIMAGENPLDIVTAAKTRNFMITIADPTTPDAVVVDRHALSIAVNRLTTEDDFKILKAKGAYDVYAEMYREAARVAGVAPSVMQAVTWVVWRETRTKFQAANRKAAGRG